MELLFTGARDAPVGASAEPENFSPGIFLFSWLVRIPCGKPLKRQDFGSRVSGSESWKKESRVSGSMFRVGRLETQDSELGTGSDQPGLGTICLRTQYYYN